MKIYQRIAHLLNAISNCQKSGNTVWAERHTESITELIRDTAPHGGGLDMGVWLMWDESTDSKLVFGTSYHHMNDNGYYDGWTDHTIIVKPSLMSGFDLSISGRDRNDIKEYLGQVYYYWLNEEVE